jgi:hypothetical protein
MKKRDAKRAKGQKDSPKPVDEDKLRDVAGGFDATGSAQVLGG